MKGGVCAAVVCRDSHNRGNRGKYNKTDRSQPSQTEVLHTGKKSSRRLGQEFVQICK